MECIGGLRAQPVAFHRLTCALQGLKACAGSQCLVDQAPKLMHSVQRLRAELAGNKDSSLSIVQQAETMAEICSSGGISGDKYVEPHLTCFLSANFEA